MSFSLKLLGGVALEGSAGPVSGPAVQRHRLALLALLAVSRPAAQSREKLVAWLWSEQDDDHARALLNQSVHALRRALGAEVILSAGNELRLNSALVRCDATAFEEAIHAEAPARAVALYSGPFLDGFFLDKAPEFERWVARERDRLETLYARALEDLAEAAQRAGDWSEAARCWKARLVHDPCDSRVVLRLMAALEREGNPAGALRHGLAHQHRLREDLEIEPDPAVLDAVARLRRESQAAPSHGENQGPLGAPPPAAAILPVASGPPSADSAASRSTRRPEAFVAAAVLLVLALVVAVGLMPGGGLRAKPATAGVDEIAQAVALELNRREQGDTTGRLPELRTTSIPAYELYLRGNDPALLRSDSAARRGLGYFEQAVALDSNYAAAWAG
ncbi:MAG TPA: BTAD domain-containing putative transcriptional regulator, partial [Gemmatimonadales bacterium]